MDGVNVDGEKLWLVEVKDYDHLDRLEVEPNAEELTTVVGQKALGTMGVLYQLQRSNDQYSEGVQLAKKAAGTSEIHVVLHIEPKQRGTREKTNAVLPPYKNSLRRDKSRGLLKVENVHVGSNFVQVAGAPWNARRDPRTRLR